MNMYYGRFCALFLSLLRNALDTFKLDRPLDGDNIKEKPREIRILTSANAVGSSEESEDDVPAMYSGQKLVWERRKRHTHRGLLEGAKPHQCPHNPGRTSATELSNSKELSKKEATITCL